MNDDAHNIDLEGMLERYLVWAPTQPETDIEALHLQLMTHLFDFLEDLAKAFQNEGIGLGYATCALLSHNQTAQHLDGKRAWLKALPTIGQRNFLSEYAAFFSMVVLPKGHQYKSNRDLNFTKLLSDGYLQKKIPWHVKLLRGELSSPRGVLSLPLPEISAQQREHLKQLAVTTPKLRAIFLNALGQTVEDYRPYDSSLFVDEVANHPDELALIDEILERTPHSPTWATDVVSRLLPFFGSHTHDEHLIRRIIAFLRLYSLMPDLASGYAFPCINEQRDGKLYGAGALVIGLAEGRLTEAQCRKLASIVAIVFSKLGALDYLAFRTRQAAITSRHDQLQSLLSNLGHDGKHEAKTIERILDTGWEGAAVAAKRFTASLAGRMSCYSRFALVSQKRQEYARKRDLEYDVKNCGSQVSVQNLFYGEFDAIIARYLAERDACADCKTLFQELFDSTPRQAALHALKARRLSVGYNGTDLQLPASVKNQDPLLMSCLRLIFSELLRNIKRHQWDDTLIPTMQQGEREIELTAFIVGDSVQLDLRFTPFVQNDVDQDSSFLGLMSIRLALETCVGMARTTKIINGVVGKVLFPEFKDGCGWISFSIPSVGFANQ